MEYINLYKKLSENIKKYRKEARLTQEKLAEIAGISLDFMGKIEANINKPSLKTVFKIAQALNIEPYQLLK
jgi:transcriptional regulator with XRE-family HTH domain